MFKPRELSRWLGRPEHLFLFSLGPLSWRFTGADRPAVLNAGTEDEQVYLPAAIERSSIKETSEQAKNNITITLPYRLDPNATEKPVTQSFGDIWRPYPPGDTVYVTCMERHVGDPDAEVNVQWYGRIAQPEFTDSTLKLTCQPSRGRSRSQDLGMRWQRGCPLVLYSQGAGMCNLDKGLHALPAAVTAVDGLLVTAAEFAAAPHSLAGGFVEWTRSNGLVDRRTVMAHNGATIELNYGAADLGAGLELVAYPGCAHNWAACEALGNTPNYGGCIYLPVKNPWDGNPVW